MKLSMPARMYPLVLLLAVLPGLAGCGEDRATLAKKTIQEYWTDVGHGQLDKAYALLSSGNRSVKTLKTYRQDMFGFLAATAGVSVKVNNVQVNNDHALAAVSLISPKSPQAPLNAYQHLFWEGGGWKISDENGGLSRHK